MMFKAVTALLVSSVAVAETVREAPVPVIPVGKKDVGLEAKGHAEEFLKEVFPEEIQLLLNLLDIAEVGKQDGLMNTVMKGVKDKATFVTQTIKRSVPEFLKWTKGQAPSVLASLLKDHFPEIGAELRTRMVVLAKDKVAELMSDPQVAEMVKDLREALATLAKVFASLKDGNFQELLALANIGESNIKAMREAVVASLAAEVAGLFKSIDLSSSDPAGSFSKVAKERLSASAEILNAVKSTVQDFVKGEPLLIAAVRTGNVRVVDFLIDHGVSLEQKDAEGHTAHKVAYQSRNYSMARHLRSRGASAPLTEAYPFIVPSVVVLAVVMVCLLAFFIYRRRAALAKIADTAAEATACEPAV